MSRHRFCPTNDGDGFIEELTQDLREEQEASEGERRWSEVDADVRQRYLHLAADTWRYRAHGHGERRAR